MKSVLDVVVKRFYIEESTLISPALPEAEIHMGRPPQGSQAREASVFPVLHRP